MAGVTVGRVVGRGRSADGRAGEDRPGGARPWAEGAEADRGGGGGCGVHWADRRRALEKSLC